MKKYRGAYLKKKANIENVRARLDLLLAGIAKPESVNPKIQRSLTSQRAFSSLAIDESAIQTVSLNTLKSISDEILLECVNGLSGFAYLDGLRSKLNLLVSTDSNVRSTEAKKERADGLIKALKASLYQVELLNLQRSKAYFDLFQRVVSIASDSGLPESLRFRFGSIVEDHRELYVDLLGPSEPVGKHKLRVVSGKSNEN